MSPERRALLALGMARANRARSTEARSAQTAAAHLPDEIVPLTPTQHWFFDRPFIDRQNYHAVYLIDAPLPLDPSLLRKTLYLLMRQHDALRLRFRNDETGWRQYYVSAESSVSAVQIDFSDVPNHRFSELLIETSTEIARSLHLSNWPLLRCAYFNRNGPDHGRLLVILHHLVSDGFSFPILFQDFQSIYASLLAGSLVQLPTKTTSFHRWAKRINEYAHTDDLANERQYWVSLPWNDVRPLPLDMRRPPEVNQYDSAEDIAVSIPADVAGAVMAASTKLDCSVAELILAALVNVLTDWTGAEAVLFDWTGHGRATPFADIDLARTVGYLTVTAPLIVRGDRTLQGLVHQARRALRSMPNGGIGFGALAYLSANANIVAQMRSLPHPQIKLNIHYQNERASSAFQFKAAPERIPGVLDHRNLRHYLLNIEVDVGAEISFRCKFCQALHRRETILSLLKSTIDFLGRLHL